MINNKFLKKIILFSLLLVLPVQTMPLPSRASFSTMKRILKKNKEPIKGVISFYTILGVIWLEGQKSVFAFVLGNVSLVLVDCIELCLTIGDNWEKAQEKKKKEAEIARKREDFRRKIRKAEEARIKEERAVKEARRKEVNDEIKERCFICLLSETESEEQLLQELKCHSGQVHTGQTHQSCLDRALRTQGKCPICRASIVVQHNILQNDFRGNVRRRAREREQLEIERLLHFVPYQEQRMARQNPRRNNISWLQGIQRRHERERRNLQNIPSRQERQVLVAVPSLV